MSRSAIEYLKHIRDETHYLIETSKELSEDKFMTDPTLQRAYSRSLEIIGEAVKNLPDEFRDEYNNLDWKSIAGMRDRLIHHYFGVDYEIVWDVVQNEIPKLKNEIETILAEIAEA